MAFKVIPVVYHAKLGVSVARDKGEPVGMMINPALVSAAIELHAAPHEKSDGDPDVVIVGTLFVCDGELVQTPLSGAEFADALK